MQHLGIIFKALLFVSIFASISLASETKNLAVVYTYDKPNDEEFKRFLKEDLATLGYYLNDPHSRVHEAFKLQFGSTSLDHLGFFPILNDKKLQKLLNKDPRFGGFSPFNLLNYRKKSDMKTVVSHLTPEAILDILQIEDPSLREEYIQSFKALDELIEKKLHGEKSYIPFHTLSEDTMMHYEISFGEVDDVEDFLDAFQEKFESTFQENGFVIAGFYNIKDSFNAKENAMPEYTSFWSFNLCHIPAAYEIFDGVDPSPEIAIFAPCSIYLYVKEGENKIVIGLPTISAWMGAFGVSDIAKLKQMQQVDAKISQILESLGGVAVANGNPLENK
jgi:uncharacterized protein (DUF302 family)